MRVAKPFLGTLAGSIVIGLVIGGLFAINTNGITQYRVGLELGTKGILSSPLEKGHECTEVSSNDLLECYIRIAKNEVHTITVSVEDSLNLWKRLSIEFSLAAARKGRLDFPHLYEIDFLDKTRFFGITARGNNSAETISLLDDIVSSIIRRHRRHVEAHKALLLQHRLQVSILLDKCSQENSEHPCWKEQTARLGVISILDTAIEGSKNTVLSVSPHLLPKSQNTIIFRVFSGGFIGLIVGLLLILIWPCTPRTIHPS